MACAVAPPGSPVFSPSSRGLLPPTTPAQVSFKQQPAAPEGSPLRLLALRAAKLRIRPAADPPLLVVPAASHAPSSSSSSSSSSSNAKRRRPPPLLVPATAPTPLDAVAAARGMEPEVAEEAGEGFAAYCRRGKGRNRLEMEDRHAAALTLGGDPSAALFAVFDGHGGKSAAEFAASNMPRIIADELRNKSSEEDVEAAVRRAYLRTDDEFSSAAAAATGGGGACCVTALLLRDRRQLVVSGAGDCRAVLGRGRSPALALTTDHRASRREERERIEGLDGGLVLRDSRGTWRVRGSLAVTRGIGDAHLKPWVLSDPETTTLDLQDDGDCELLVLASDGLWDKVGNQEAVDACCSAALPPAAACRRLVDMAVARGSTDDISVLVVHLKRLLLHP